MPSVALQPLKQNLKWDAGAVVVDVYFVPLSIYFS
jgi:hypothetical protein